MRIFPSRRRGGGEEDCSTAIVSRRSSHGDHRGGNDDQEPVASPLTGGRRKMWFRARSKMAANAATPRTSPYALYSDEELSPRASAWLYLSAASIAGLSSLLVTEQAIDEAMDEAMEDGAGGERSAIDSLVVVVLSISFALSLLIAAAYRHRGLRERLTGNVRYLRASLEFVLGVISFCLWTVVLRYVTDPFSGLDYGLTMVTVDGYEEVWNMNIWVCAWLGWGISSYLVGALLMAPKSARSGVRTWGLDVVASPSSHRDSNESSGPSIEIARTENGLTLWFMLLSFSVALSAYSIVLRTGDACTNFLSTTPFCKRSSLGGAVGLSCALLAITAMSFHGMNQRGSLDQWSTKEKILPRIELSLAVLCLVLHAVNMGYGTSPSGPSTQLSNLFITTLLGVILSLMLCEQVASGNVPQVHPPRRQESWAVSGKQKSPMLRISGSGGVVGDDDCRHSSSSSSSGSSSSSDASPHDASTVQHHNESQDLDLEASNVAVAGTGAASQAKREFISAKSTKKKGSGRTKKLTSSGLSMSGSSDVDLTYDYEDTTNETPSSYSLPQPPPIYSSSPSERESSFAPQSQSTSMNRPFTDSSSPPPVPDNFTPNYSAKRATDDDSEDDGSGVELEFVPEDDVSTLECSLMSKDTARTSQEPDGWKSDDDYEVSRTRATAQSKKSWRQNNTSQRENALDPVEEASADLESNSSPQSPPKEQANQTIVDIMNRGVNDLSRSAKAESQARKMSQKFARHDDDNSESTNNEGGPATVESVREDDEAVNRALKKSSFFSTESANVYNANGHVGM